MIIISRAVLEERRYKVSILKRLSKAVQRYWELKMTEETRNAKMEVKRVRKLAKGVGGEVKKKWKLVEAIIQARHREIVQQEEQAAGKRHLDAIIEHSTHVLTSAARDGVAGLPSSTPAYPDPRRRRDKRRILGVAFGGGVDEGGSGRNGRSRSRTSTVGSVASGMEDDEDESEEEDENEEEGGLSSLLGYDDGDGAEEDDNTGEGNSRKDGGGRRGRRGRGGGDADDEDSEMDTLAQEGDMPLEELLRKYGYLVGEDAVKETHAEDEEEEREEGGDE
ncbi:swr1 complex component, partial [Quaeritorhiza haematococci]